MLELCYRITKCAEELFCVTSLSLHEACPQMSGNSTVTYVLCNLMILNMLLSAQGVGWWKFRFMSKFTARLSPYAVS